MSVDAKIPLTPTDAQEWLDDPECWKASDEKVTLSYDTVKQLLTSIVNPAIASNRRIDFLVDQMMAVTEDRDRLVAVFNAAEPLKTWHVLNMPDDEHGQGLLEALSEAMLATGRDY